MLSQLQIAILAHGSLPSEVSRRPEFGVFGFYTNITSTLHTLLAKALVCDCSRVSGLRKSFNIARRGPGVLLGITRRGSAVEELQTCR